MEKFVVFDVDGTLNQTALYAVEAYKKALKKRNIKVEEDEIISCIGLSPEAIIGKLFGSLTNEEYKSWRSDIKKYEFEIMDTNAKAFDGMKETLIELKDRGYKLAICSNAYKQHVENVLKVIKLEGLFDEIGTLELGDTKYKVLSTLLKKLGNPKACMVGDRIFDVEAAKYNNVPIIGCAYGYAPNEIRNADYIINKPIEILEFIDKLFN